jgi:hypothetical protein
LKLIIHCGLHKTATTSFQNLCAENRSLLRSLGIHYPTFGERNQHSYLMHDVQRSGIGTLGAYLAECRAQAAPNCDTVLLSGEDFENCIADLALASDVEAVAQRARFDSVVWVVVTRSSNDILNSLYAEMSRHGVVLNRDLMQKAASDLGCIYMTTERYNYVFVIDFERFAARFRQHVSGEVVEYRYNDFVRPYPGMQLLKQFLSEDAFIQFQKSAAKSNVKANRRLTGWQVEANYLATALGSRILRSPVFGPILAPFIYLRLRRARRFTKNVSPDNA